MEMVETLPKLGGRPR